MTNKFPVYSPLTRKSVKEFTQKNTEEKDEKILTIIILMLEIVKILLIEY